MRHWLHSPTSHQSDATCLTAKLQTSCMASSYHCVCLQVVAMWKVLQAIVCCCTHPLRCPIVHGKNPIQLHSQSSSRDHVSCTSFCAVIQILPSQQAWNQVFKNSWGIRVSSELEPVLDLLVQALVRPIEWGCNLFQRSKFLPFKTLRTLVGNDWWRSNSWI